MVALCMITAVRIALQWIDGVDVQFTPIVYQPSAEGRNAMPMPVAGLFGTASETDYGFDTPLPATPLQLTLRGVVTGRRGYAIIVDGSGDEGVYRVDDELSGDTRVVAIEPRRVVLERNGQREALALPGTDGSQSASSPRASRPAEAGPVIRRGLGIASLGSMADAMKLDPETLSRQITILPVAGGGFRVSAGRNAALFQQLGFQRNDVVTAINGQPVNNQSDVRALFQTLRPGDGLAITVRRGDQQRVLTPNLDSITGFSSP